MIRLRLFRPVLTLALVAVLGNGFPPAAGHGGVGHGGAGHGGAGHGGAVPLLPLAPDGVGAPMAPFTPPRA